MIRGIIFDCFGVLTADKWHEFRCSLPAELQGEASELNQQYCRGELQREAFLAAVARLTGRERGFVAQLIDNEQDKNRRLLEYIASLREQYKIGLLSNIATPWITDHFLTAQEQALFDEMVFSFEAGMTKPDPRIYQLTCERLQVEPRQAVMIDDIEHYCQAARDTGMQAITYKNFVQFCQELERILAQTDNVDVNRA